MVTRRSTAALSEGATPRVALVILAAGSSRRAETVTNKVLLPLAGRPVVTWTLEWATGVLDLETTLVVCRGDEMGTMRAVLDREAPERRIELVEGGQTRHGSEYAALVALRDRITSGAVDVVVIHDSARPLAAPRLFADVVEVARAHGGALPALPLPAVVFAEGRRPTGELVGVQTPQAFLAEELLTAYDRAEMEGFDGTDTAASFERFGGRRVHTVLGDPRNMKITFPEDLFVAERILADNHQRL